MRPVYSEGLGTNKRGPSLSPSHASKPINHFQKQQPTVNKTMHCDIVYIQITRPHTGKKMGGGASAKS